MSPRGSEGVGARKAFRTRTARWPAPSPEPEAPILDKEEERHESVASRRALRRRRSNCHAPRRQRRTREVGLGGGLGFGGGATPPPRLRTMSAAERNELRPGHHWPQSVMHSCRCIRLYIICGRPQKLGRNGVHRGVRPKGAFPLILAYKMPCWARNNEEKNLETWLTGCLK